MAALPIENFDKSLEIVNHVFAAKGLPSFLFRHKTLQQGLNHLLHLKKECSTTWTDEKG